MTASIKLIDLTGNDATILITYEDNSTETVILNGLPVEAEEGETNAEIINRFVEAVKAYIKKYVESKPKAIVPSAAIISLVGQSTTINLD